jgi:iron(III) transport system substrate-binding protein
MASAPHKAVAVKFLEYMASDEAQKIISDNNYEFPAVAGMTIVAELQALGRFKTDPINVAVYGQNQAQAQAIFDRAGWR